MGNCRNRGPELLLKRRLARFCEIVLRQLRLLFANALHHVFNYGLYLIGRESKRVTIGNESDGLPSAVHNDLARLAFVQMLLKAGSDFRAGRLFQVIPEFREKLSAA